VKLVPSKKSAEEEEEEAFAEVLAGKTARMAEAISKNTFGAFSTEDPDADSYYLIFFTSDVYTLQQDIELKEYDPPMILKAGELVVNADYYNKVPGAQLWYTHNKVDKTVVRVQQVVAADLHVAPISETNKLPPGMNKKNKADATKQKAIKVSSEDHELILDEICRREELEQEELVEDDESEDESEEEDGSEEEEGKEGA
jgi:hypothetical protein